MVVNVSPPANATYGLNQNLDFTVTFSEPVVTGIAISLPITVGWTDRQAKYLSGNGTSDLIFRYTVQYADVDVNGVAVGAALSLATDTLKDEAGNDAQTTLNNVGSTTLVLVDTGAYKCSDLGQMQLVAKQRRDIAEFVRLGELRYVVCADDLAPTVAITGPVGAVSDPFEVTATFSEGVRNFDQTDVVVTNGTASAFATISGSVYTFTVTPNSTETVSIDIPAAVALDVNDNENTAAPQFNVSIGSPTTEFENNRAAVQTIITAQATQALRTQTAANINFNRDAKERLINRSDIQTTTAEPKRPPFTIEPAALSEGRLAINGNVSHVEDMKSGSWVTYGDGNIARDGQGTTTASLSTRQAFEVSLSDETLLGIHISAHVADSDIKSTFDGQNKTYGAAIGAYAVRSLGKSLFADAYAQFGLSRSNITLDNETLALDGDYNTDTFLIGGALSGVIAIQHFEIRPEISFSYGHSRIGVATFDATFNGDTEAVSLDPSSVKLATLRFSPELWLPLADAALLQGPLLITLAPRFTCEYTDTNDATRQCGSGASVALSNSSANGDSQIGVKFEQDWFETATRSSFSAYVEHRF